MFGVVLMHTYLDCYYQCVPLTRAISGFLFAMLLLWNTKSNKSELMFSLKFCHLILYLSRPRVPVARRLIKTLFI